MTELWQYIEDKRYAVSNMGKVASCLTGIFLKPRINSSGYHIVSLYNSGKRTDKCIHRLVAENFVEGRSEINDIAHHKDNNKLNNVATNIKWTDHSDNMVCMYRHKKRNGGK